MSSEDGKIIPFPDDPTERAMGKLAGARGKGFAQILPDVKPTELPQPVLITDADFALVLHQCELQGATTKEEIANFLNAYTHAKKFAFKRDLSRLSTRDVLGLVLELGRKTCPDKNQKGFRIVPVNFENLTQAVDTHLLERVVENWAEIYASNLVESVEIYKEFENIHPFEDGNGRVGHLLWAIDVMRKIGQWPLRLPPDVFGENSGYQKRRYESSFGEVED